MLLKHMWALIALVFAITVGGFVTEASAKTNAENVACRDAGFAALPFSGTLAEKEAHARNLAIGTEVLVDGVMVKLAAGESLWSRCATAPTAPTPLQVANARISALETERGRLEGLAYKSIATRYTATDFVATGVTWKDTATALKAERDAAQADLKSSTTLVWFLIIALLAGIAGLWFNRQALAAKFGKPAPRPTPEPAPSEFAADDAASDLGAERPDPIRP